MRVASSIGSLARPAGEAVPLDRSTVMGRSIVDMQPVHIADLQNAPDDLAAGREMARRFGHRTILAMPLVREGRAQWLQRVGRWLAPVPKVTKGCDGCNSCDP
jgi:hypothetical protein